MTGGFACLFGCIGDADKDGSAGFVDLGDFGPEADKELVSGIGGVHHEKEGNTGFFKIKLLF